jgi:hypothetical protein
MRLIYLMFYFLSLPVQSATYYLSSTGNDNADGKTPTTAWKTINKINMIALVDGDVVLFKRGEVFRGEINSNKSPKNITFSAFGDGDRPVIAGSVQIGNWRPSARGTGIWETDLATAPQQLFANGKLMTIARFPNVDSPLQRNWLKVKTNAGTDAFTDTALLGKPANYWQGATLRIRDYSWTFKVLPITGFDAATGKITATGLGNQLPEWGYFLEGKLEELDAPNEWFYDAASQKLYFYPPLNQNPNQMLIEGSVFATGLTIANYEDNSKVENLVFRHFTDKSLHINNSANVSVKNCHFELNVVGLSVWNAQNVLISGNTFNYNLMQAIVLQSATTFNVGNAVVEKNVILNTGMFAGYGRRTSGTYQGLGISVFGKAFIVKENFIKNTSHAGIDLKDSGQHLIENNVVLDSLQLLNDGGAIVMGADGNQIRGNFLLNSLGNVDESNGCGSTNTTPCSHHSTYGMGIGANPNYKNNFIENNVIANNPDMGIRLNAFANTNVINNLVFNNDPAIVLEDKNNASTGNVVENNTIFSTHPNQLGLSLNSTTNQGVYRNNYYCNPYSDLAIIQANQRYSLTHWQQRGFDALSKWCNVRFPEYLTTPVENNQILNSFFNQDIINWSNTKSFLDTTGQLDGNSLRVEYPNDNADVNIGTNALNIEQNQWYKLSFSVKGAGFGDIQLRGNRTSPSPYLILEERFFAILPERRDYSWVFPAKQNSNAFKWLWTTDNQDSSKYWLDNVTFEKVNATPISPQILSKLLINPLPTPRQITLGETVYRDLNGQTVKTSIDLAPYSAKVLLYAEGKIPPPAPPSVWLVQNGKNITLAWTRSDDATAYRLYYAPYPNVDYIKSLDVGQLSDLSIDLWSGAAFYIAITALNSNGESNYSNILWFAIP